MIMEDTIEIEDEHRNSTKGGSIITNVCCNIYLICYHWYKNQAEGAY